jgi:circadian clock protein KaiC
MSNQAIVREALHRLFRWLKKKGVTVIMTAECGEGPLTRHGLEEYVSDCVISLDHRVLDQSTTRRMRVVKYRGATHGTNEYPFLIDKDGISIWPVTSIQLEHQTSDQRIPTGIEQLDAMLGGPGYYRGSSILLSGMAGTGKTSVGATFADATCRRGERCQFFSFEESPGQIKRNMSTIGLDLQQWVKKGRLQFQTVRPFHYGLEMHLARTIRLITEFEPQVVVVDQMSGLETTGTPLELKAAMMRLIDFLKMKGITAMYTDLTTDSNSLALTDAAISSLVDTWLILRDLELNGERNRSLHILKSRGMAHSNQVREFIMSERGIELKEVYIGPSGMLTGSARVAQEARERAVQASRNEEIELRQLDLKRKHDALEGQIAALRAEFSAEEARIEQIIGHNRQHEQSLAHDQEEMGRSRKNDNAKPVRSLFPKNGSNGRKS